ncbi:MAG: VWA domain-containing protein [Terriglobales bacterium]
MPLHFRVVALSLFLLAAAWTQQPSIPVFHAEVGEVLVQVSVLDRHGRAVTDLPASGFTVYENGVVQKIDSFSSGDAPISQGILVDNSGSMASKRVQVDEAALNFVRAGNPQDETFIVKFNDLYHLVAPFTNNIAVLERGLGAIHPAYSTAMYDAVIRGVEYMNRFARRPKKVILLISDGEDDSSAHSLEQTETILQAQDAPMVYCIGLFDRGDDSFVRNENARALHAIADWTGGAAYFPKNLSQVNVITRKVAQDIRLQYSLIYQSNQPAPGYHAIRVEVKDPHHKHLRALTRRGYYRRGGS